MAKLFTAVTGRPGPLEPRPNRSLGNAPVPIMNGFFTLGIVPGPDRYNKSVLADQFTLPI